MESIVVKDNRELQLHVYVLGYYPEGESILIVLWDNSTKQPLKSILTDCYEQNGVNKIYDKLNLYGLKTKKLDYVVWTHPDKDHSVGFSSIVKDYSTRETLFLIPDGWFAFRNFLDKEKRKSWMFLVKQRMANNRTIETINVSNRRKHPLEYTTLYCDGYSDDFEFGVEILTPFADQVSRHVFINKTREENDISISFIIKFGKVGFYFGGDSENDAIKRIIEDKFKNVIFVKIPHHGSNSSDALPEILERIHKDDLEQIISVSTGFHIGNNSLPLIEVLDYYKKISSDVLVTEDTVHTNRYGLWCCKFNRKSSKPIELNADGDAIKYQG